MADKSFVDQYALPTFRQTRRRLRPSISTILLLCLASLCSVVVYQTHFPTGSGSADVHAVCSAQGADIYTVDENNTKVQCIVIRDSFVAATGSEGRMAAFARLHDLTPMQRLSSPNGHQSILNTFRRE